jgi:putative membrane protein
MLLVIDLFNGVLNSFIYALLGIVMAVFAAKVIDWITPGNLFRQITEEKNLPLAIFTGLMVLGVCIIIAAAIAG